MKKSVVAMLTGALVVGATATTFAAANPFSDVPAGHWAYNSITKMAADGIIEGYGDGTFRGNRNITRYEAAQMIAKAMAKNPTGSARGDLDKLAAEFRDELDSLGVRVAELEKHADMVQWTGKIEYTYGHKKFSGGAKTSGHDGVFRLEPKAYVNDHWTANARFDANYNGQKDSTGYTESDGSKAGVKLKRVFAEGNYNKFGVKIGRFGFCPDPEGGVVWDTVISGAELTFGSKWQFAVTAGRVGADSDEAHYEGIGLGSSDHPTDAVRIGVQYNQGETGLYGGASWSYAKDKDFRYGFYSKDYTDKANVWSVNLGYKVNDKLNIGGSYAQNTKADHEDYGWDALVNYGNYADASEQGQWSIWAGYSHFGWNVGLGTSQGDDIQQGDKGWHVGAAYAPFKNVGLLARYGDGKDITSGVKTKKTFARIEYFF